MATENCDIGPSAKAEAPEALAEGIANEEVTGSGAAPSGSIGAGEVPSAANCDRGPCATPAESPEAFAAGIDTEIVAPPASIEAEPEACDIGIWAAGAPDAFGTPGPVPRPEATDAESQNGEIDACEANGEAVAEGSGAVAARLEDGSASCPANIVSAWGLRYCMSEKPYG